MGNGGVQSSETSGTFDAISDLAFCLLRFVEAFVHVHRLDVFAMFANERKKPDGFEFGDMSRKWRWMR